MFCFRLLEEKWSVVRYFVLSPKSILDTVNLTARSLKELSRESESYPVMCLGDASKYYYGIKKHSKKPFNIKIDSFQPGSMLVVLSCPNTCPGKTNKVCIFVQSRDLERPIRSSFFAETCSLNYSYSLNTPYLTYGLMAWGQAYKWYLEKLFKLQKRALHFFCFSERIQHTIPLFINAPVFYH